jgi:hypothetical protein
MKYLLFTALFLLSMNIVCAYQTINIVSENGEDCQVFIGYRYVGNTPCSYTAAPGNYVIKVFHPQSGRSKTIIVRVGLDPGTIPVIVFDPIRWDIYRSWSNPQPHFYHPRYYLPSPPPPPLHRRNPPYRQHHPHPRFPRSHR